MYKSDNRTITVEFVTIEKAKKEEVSKILKREAYFVFPEYDLESAIGTLRFTVFADHFHRNSTLWTSR